MSFPVNVFSSVLLINDVSKYRAKAELFLLGSSRIGSSHCTINTFNFHFISYAISKQVCILDHGKFGYVAPFVIYPNITPFYFYPGYIFILVYSESWLY